MGCRSSNVNVAIVDNDAPKIVINELDADQAGTDTASLSSSTTAEWETLRSPATSLVFFNGNDTNPGLTNGSSVVSGRPASQTPMDSFCWAIPA